MALTPSRLFQLERIRRTLRDCEDPEQLREIAESVLKMYLLQQQTVERLINQGWLPGDEAP